MQLEYPAGATPLDPDEAQGLVPAHIATQSDLNAWEEANIVQAEQWLRRSRKREVLEEGFVRDLHARMFDKTWKWAGTFRKSNKNIGVDWTQVAVKLRNLLDNTRYQVEQGTDNVDELVVRMHHQLVWIHAFPNGNGRHARLMADVLIMRLGRPRFSWGRQNLVHEGQTRSAYLAALRLADRGDISALLEFARD